uniref:Acetyltransferase domain protein n=1 Tax=Rhizobium rhizogenes TaxID=359 RepID=A0A7S4ZSV5_RHIRH|nr:GNAT family N-acetyltransferase [Rhizobium rhizogenes]QCL10550.1 acetyltransferase domain protein [Rhizobium rhizogenes]QCO89357.1 acetyltransferase domain protein [Rhizobium rhizogenes]
MVDIEIKLDPSEDDRKAIVDPLLAFNDSKAGDDGYKPLAILLRDDEGKIQGGLTAKCYYNWVFVDLLFVPEALRGQNLGTKLLAHAERWAKEQGCIGIWLDTFSFQAPGFYEKQGYSVFGKLENYPNQNERVFLRKLL